MEGSGREGGAAQGWRRPVRRLEWPTLLLAGLIYAAWAMLTFLHARLPLPLFASLGAWTVAWQTSLQHEIIHGHPTRSRRVNRLIGLPPLLVWLPFESYRLSHLVHHRDERLTDPLDDPESHYWTAEAWARLSPARRLVGHANATLLGRVTLGPGWAMLRFLSGEVRAVWACRPGARALWARHLALVGLVLAWTWGVCGIDPLAYLALVVYPATALMLVRSFAEHRAASEVDERTALVERAPVLGLLYLYNNLHAVHHDRPGLPWYRIPAWYRANRERLVAENGGLVYRGYLDVARRYLLRPHDSPVHPFGRAPDLAASRADACPTPANDASGSGPGVRQAA